VEELEGQCLTGNTTHPANLVLAGVGAVGLEQALFELASDWRCPSAVRRITPAAAGAGSA